MRIVQWPACLLVWLFLSTPARAATYTVEIQGGFFSPAQLTIQQGDTVTWVWMAPGHSTTRYDAPESWNSGVINTVGHEFSHTFQTAGSFAYFCIPHAPHMSGTITVEQPAKADTTTSLVSSKNPSAAGESVTFTATVQGEGGTPAGTVTFLDADSEICSNVTLSGGSAACTKSDLGQGDHSITAVYSGDADFNGSTSAPLVQTVAAAPGVPAAFSATAVSTSAVALAWSAVSGATAYEIVRSSLNGPYEPLPMTGDTSMNDAGRAPDTTYLYKVRAIGPGGSSDFTAPDAATTILFTDTALAGAAIKAVHVMELRTAVDAMRAAAGLGAAAFTDHPLAAGTRVKAAHITELRTLLDAARAEMTLPALTYTDPALTSGVVARAAHALELRDGTR